MTLNISTLRWVAMWSVKLRALRRLADQVTTYRIDRTRY
jgi:hypothetical protein